jgi:hypothetical protein
MEAGSLHPEHAQRTPGETTMQEPVSVNAIPSHKRRQEEGTVVLEYSTTLSYSKRHAKIEGTGSFVCRTEAAALDAIHLPRRPSNTEAVIRPNRECRESLVCPFYSDSSAS